MELGIELSTYLPVMLLVGGLGAAWIAVRMVFKLARRFFMMGCLAIIILGVFIFLAGSNLPGM